MKIFQIALLAAAATALRLEDDVTVDDLVDMGEEAGLGPKDLEELEKLPLEELDEDDVKEIVAALEKGEKPPRKQPKKELGELPEGLTKDDVKAMMKEAKISVSDLEDLDSEELDKKAKKAGFSKDEIKMAREAIEQLDSEDLELGQKKPKKQLGDKKKPKKLGEKKGPKPPKKDEDGEIELDSGDEEMIKKEMEKRGLKLEDFEGLNSDDADEIMKELELADKKKPKKLGEKGPKPEGELEPPCAESDDECWAELEKELPCALSDDECWEALEAEFEGEGDKPEGKKPKGPKPEGDKPEKAELAEGDKPKKGDKPPKKDEGCGFEKEAREALEDFDGDGSGRLEAGEGKEVLKAIGLPEDVADMLIEGAEEELDEAPTADDIAGAMCELARHFAEKEGVSVDEVADFTKDVDFSKVTKDDVEEFAAYVEAEVEF